MYALHIPPLSFFLFEQPNTIFQRVQIVKFLTMQFIYSPVTPTLLRPDNPLSIQF
jgi:hypothetical protein